MIGAEKREAVSALKVSVLLTGDSVAMRARRDASSWGIIRSVAESHTEERRHSGWRQGTRLSEEIAVWPKPMVEIGGHVRRRRR
jgi:hypothetical protein